MQYILFTLTRVLFHKLCVWYWDPLWRVNLILEIQNELYARYRTPRSCPHRNIVCYVFLERTRYTSIDALAVAWPPEVHQGFIPGVISQTLLVAEVAVR